MFPTNLFGGKLNLQIRSLISLLCLIVCGAKESALGCSWVWDADLLWSNGRRGFVGGRSLIDFSPELSYFLDKDRCVSIWLIVRTGLSISGSPSLGSSTPLSSRYFSLVWRVCRIDVDGLDLSLFSPPHWVQNALASWCNNLSKLWKTSLPF